jgi:hypothetical protein
VPTIPPIIATPQIIKPSGIKTVPNTKAEIVTPTSAVAPIKIDLIAKFLKV